jgi:hypothetical protein
LALELRYLSDPKVGESIIDLSYSVFTSHGDSCGVVNRSDVTSHFLTVYRTSAEKTFFSIPSVSNLGSNSYLVSGGGSEGLNQLLIAQLVRRAKRQR